MPRGTSGASHRPAQLSLGDVALFRASRSSAEQARKRDGGDSAAPEPRNARRRRRPSRQKRRDDDHSSALHQRRKVVTPAKESGVHISGLKHAVLREAATVLSPAGSSHSLPATESDVHSPLPAQPTKRELARQVGSSLRDVFHAESVTPGATNAITAELNRAAEAYIRRLSELDASARAKSNFNSRRRRIVWGLKEINKLGQNGRVRMLLIASDVDACDTVQKALHDTIEACKAGAEKGRYGNKSVETLFCLKLTRIARALGQRGRTTAVAVLDDSGAEEARSQLLKELMRAREIYSLEPRVHDAVARWRSPVVADRFPFENGAGVSAALSLEEGERPTWIG